MSANMGTSSSDPNPFPTSNRLSTERGSISGGPAISSILPKTQISPAIKSNAPFPPQFVPPSASRQQFSYYGVLTPMLNSAPAKQRISPSDNVPSQRKEDANSVTSVSSPTPFPQAKKEGIASSNGTNDDKTKNDSILIQGPPAAVMQAHQLSPAQLSMEQNGIKASGKHSTQYMMSDGQIICGKGLGRGRPGIKRGPRAASSASEMSEDASNTINVTSPAVDMQQSASTKRKRTNSEKSHKRSSETASTPISKESTPEYNPTSTQTRSGRQSQKPVPIIAPESTNTSPATKRQSGSITSSPAVKKHPKIKAKVYRGREQFALCEHCLRGNGPLGNVIVFCDACNKCWHQNCHDPRISKEVVADSKAQWFCAECDRILHGKKKSKAAPQVKSEVPATAVAAASPIRRFGPPLVGAISLTPPQRREYLNTLSKDKLIDLILRAGDLAPQLPMFESPQSAIPVYNPTPQPQFASSYVTPVDKAPVPAEAQLEDEGYDDSYDEHAALYPKAGEGVKLPPESVDLHMLLEGPGCKTFSHWMRGMPVKTTV